MPKLKPRLIDATADHMPTNTDLLDLACDFIDGHGLADEFLKFAEEATIVSSWDNVAEVEYRDNLHCVRLELE